MATTKAHYNVDGKPGLVRTARSRVTGTQINIWFSPESKGIKTNEAKPFTVECVDHGKRKECETRREAGQHRLDPRSFCATCKTESHKASKAAPKATPAKSTTAKKAPAAKKAAPKKATAAKRTKAAA